MCGICGFFGKKDRVLLEAMTGELTHRGPDDCGLFEDEAVSLGHRRLSIIDLTANASQPICNEDGSIWLVVNGEIYNYADLRKELISLGHAFKSSGDSEVIIHAYEEYPYDYVHRLEGMFAFALWDSHKHKLILGRDRLGIKPLYYAWQGNRLIFASEIKAILKDKSNPVRLNEGGFLQYLAFQCITSSETMYKGIYKLEPATLAVFDGKELSRRKYWSIDEPAALTSDTTALIHRLRESVRSHLVSDVPVGVMLSGGLDSSSLVAIMHEEGVRGIRTFTVGFGEPDDEFGQARLVANRFNTIHHEITIRPQQLSGLLENIVWHMDEPLSDVGAIATYLAASEIRKSVKVVLVGEGGDEALAGYNWHRLSAFPLRLIPWELKKKIYFYLTTFYRQRFRQPFEHFDQVFGREESFLRSMSSYEINYLIPNSTLMKVDKMTMAHALEARVPFLDRRFLEASFSISDKAKISCFMTKLFLRRLMSGRLPHELLGRRKHGFILPAGKWLKGELRGFCRDMLFSSGSFTGKFFSKVETERLFRPARGLTAIENNSLLWKLFIFEVWRAASKRERQVL